MTVMSHPRHFLTKTVKFGVRSVEKLVQYSLSPALRGAATCHCHNASFPTQNFTSLTWIVRVLRVLLTYVPIFDVGSVRSFAFVSTLVRGDIR
jgi:hypothetical protein